MHTILLALAQGFSVLLPILLSGLFFIACIKKGWLAALNKPIDAGASIGGKAIFGPNKNWRGPIIYIVGGTAVTLALHALAAWQPWVARVYLANPWLLGLGTTTAYSVAELVNSFIKRRLGLAPGAAGSRFQDIADNIDGALGSGLVLLFFGLPLWLLAVSFVLSVLVHASTDALMRALSLKKAKQ